MHARTSARVAPALAGTARVALGLLWLHEGILKFRAGFGAADIQLVVASTASNSCVPGFFQVFTDTVLGAAPGVFGVLMPVLEVLLGVALILGVLTLRAVGASAFTLMSYWLADQLIWQYPVMVLLSAVVLLFPAAARSWSARDLFVRRLRRGSSVRTVFASALARGRTAGGSPR